MTRHGDGRSTSSTADGITIGLGLSLSLSGGRGGGGGGSGGGKSVAVPKRHSTGAGASLNMVEVGSGDDTAETSSTDVVVAHIATVVLNSCFERLEVVLESVEPG